VILYNDRLLVVMDHNGGRITHIFAIHNGRAVTISGNIKAYQYLGDEREHGGRLPSDGDVFQNTVSSPNHLYVANDLPQSRPRASKKWNNKPKVKTVTVGDRDIRLEDGVFGDEDWLYPDNFNHYQRLQRLETDADVIWAYPGLSWDRVPHDSREFAQMLADYRRLVKDGQASAEPAASQFTKTITLASNTIGIKYSGPALRDHVVANEFSLDHLTALVRGRRQTRRGWHTAKGMHREGYGVRAITLSFPGHGPSVSLELGPQCRFSFDTLEGDGNGRLRRAFSHCLEVQSIADDGFEYQIRVH
jgi:hypothetical protein